MRNSGQLLLGLAIILIGVALLVGNVLDVDVWKLFWPALIILVGLALLFRPRLVGSRAATSQVLIGDIRRYGQWQVTHQDFWIGVGDVKLDMTQAEIPPGETRINVSGFVADVKLTVPEGVGVAVSSSGFWAETRLFGQKREALLTPVHLVSEGYETAERKIRLETSSFVADVKVRRA